jgi:hypothetical protein
MWRSSAAQAYISSHELERKDVGPVRLDSTYLLTETKPTTFARVVGLVEESNAKTSGLTGS